MLEPSVAQPTTVAQPATVLRGVPRRRKRLRLYLAGTLVLVLAGLCVAGAVKSDRDADPELISFVTPDRIGPLTLAANQTPSSPGRRILIAGFSHWALTLHTSDRVLDSSFAAVEDSGDKIGDRFDIDPARRGAKAQCAEVLGEAVR